MTARSASETPASSGERSDVLVVGAGPTGLTLAAQLRGAGVRFRIIDRLPDRGHESRALAVQARTLEIFDSLGIADTLVGRGNPSVRVVLHVRNRVVGDVRLGAMAAGASSDTRFPFILFVSQAETEAVLIEHLASNGVTIERGVELVRFGMDHDGVWCVLRRDGAREETLRTRYIVGCDGAHSTVRHGAGIPFEGGAYPEAFVLGDVEIDGPITPGAVNPFVGDRGVSMCFPLGRPTTWRVIGMSPTQRTSEPSAGDQGEHVLSLAELQQVVDGATGGALRLRDAAWLTRFHLHHRQTAHYRAGRAFLAGDAAHIHSPVGAQGMNTGIQDAWNLGWKLAMAIHGVSSDDLLDTYEAERWPVGRFLVRVTDRVFGTFVRLTTPNAVTKWVQGVIVPHLLPTVFRSRRLRAKAFRLVSELDIGYRKSPAVTEGKPRLARGPRAGDRLPDLPVRCDGEATSLHRVLAGPQLQLLLCGPRGVWSEGWMAELEACYGVWLRARHLGEDDASDLAGAHTLRSLGVDAATPAAQYLVRPDGHVGFRCGGTEPRALDAYLARWFPRRSVA